MRLAFANHMTVLERGPTVVGPGQLEDARRALDSPDPKAGTKPPGWQVSDELRGGPPKAGLLRSRQPCEVPLEWIGLRERRHA